MAIFAKVAFRPAPRGPALLGCASRSRPSSVDRRRARHPALPPAACSPASGSAPFGFAAQAGLYFGALKRLDASPTRCCSTPTRRSSSSPRWRSAASAPTAAARRARARVAGALLLLGGGGSGSFETVGVVLALVAAVAYSTYILVADAWSRSSTRCCSRARHHRRRRDVRASPAPSTAGSTSRSRRTAGSTSPGSSWSRRSCRSARSSSASSASARRRASILSCFEPVVTVSLAIRAVRRAARPGAARRRRAGARRGRPAAG